MVAYVKCLAHNYGINNMKYLLHFMDACKHSISLILFDSVRFECILFIETYVRECVCVCPFILFDKSKIWYDAKVLIYMFNCLFHVTRVHTLTTKWFLVMNLCSEMRRKTIWTQTYLWRELNVLHAAKWQ